ncbi:hypothetical protein L1987_37662 [Smallanthus sonchifolius]|uniref:Uncharacterized protein n=1 Tax=Smallanthus sonchifolius TaxID=185202 RepID=A0ACB9HGZ3_9ASTR|nr:hypothetical protein L1987_37662 [Smallanthus sonchifolius]
MAATVGWAYSSISNGSSLANNDLDRNGDIRPHVTEPATPQSLSLITSYNLLASMIEDSSSSYSSAFKSKPSVAYGLCRSSTDSGANFVAGLDKDTPAESENVSTYDHEIRKERIYWSTELHRQFFNTLHQLGGSQAVTPKQIGELMQVDGLTNDEVKSHLQVPPKLLDHMISVRNMLVHFILILFTMIVPEGATTNNTAKPGYPTKCGNITVPYPFGIGTYCSLEQKFNLTCNISNYDPPKHFVGKIRIYNVSDSELRVFTRISYICYNQTGVVYEHVGWSNLTRFFTFSVKNKFTVLGCDNYALITGTNRGDFSSGCFRLCRKERDVRGGECSGNRLLSNIGSHKLQCYT